MLVDLDALSINMHLQASNETLPTLHLQWKALDWNKQMLDIHNN